MRVIKGDTRSLDYDSYVFVSFLSAMLHSLRVRCQALQVGVKGARSFRRPGVQSLGFWV